jgi:hypothetical protein
VRRSKKHPNGTPVAERMAYYTLINLETGCHDWLGCKRMGYGQIRVAGRTARAHRVAWELKNGPVPCGLHLDHLCRNRGCVNPAHLEPVTHRENVLRGVGPTAINVAKTHCGQGHALSGANLDSWTLKHGHRKCVICKRATNRSYKASRRRALTCVEVAVCP